MHRVESEDLLSRVSEEKNIPSLESLGSKLFFLSEQLVWMDDGPCLRLPRALGVELGQISLNLGDMSGTGDPG